MTPACIVRGPERSRPGAGLMAAMLLNLFLAAAPASADDATPVEYAVKAAFLTKFGLYVQWPNTAFAAPGSPVNICVLGEDPFGAALDEVASGQKIDARTIAIRRIKEYTREYTRDTACHVMYIADLKSLRSGQAVDLIRGNHILTVTDERAPSTGTGIIHFVIRNGRVRFNIDDEMAAQNGLTISSKLLSLAVDIKRRPQKELSK